MIKFAIAGHAGKVEAATFSVPTYKRLQETLQRELNHSIRNPPAGYYPGTDYLALRVLQGWGAFIIERFHSRNGRGKTD